MTLTKLLAEVKQRLAGATPGQWLLSTSMDGRRGRVYSDDARQDICFYDPDEPICHRQWKINNFTLIANCPSDLAKLIKIVEVQKAALDFYVAKDTWQAYGTEALGDSGDNAREAIAECEKIAGGEG